MRDGERFERLPDLEVHEAEDGLVVFDPETDSVHHLNSTAAVLFELCDGARDVEVMAGIVADLFSLEEPPIAPTEEALTLLLREGVIRSVDPGGA